MMRVFRASIGPFTERPYYTMKEIENLCSDELYKVGLMPSGPNPIRIERFIEKRFKVSPAYEDLILGVLGLIEFGRNGVKTIKISKSLTEERSKIAERRINTTLAHEAGHGLLHAHLFVFGEKPLSLFKGDLYPNESGILCRGEDIQGLQGRRTKKYEWWEYQANLAIGPLLLPRSLVKIALQPFLVEKGLLGIEGLDQIHRDSAIKLLSEVFEVNPIVARIRLDALYRPEDSGQLAL